MLAPLRNSGRGNFWSEDKIDVAWLGRFERGGFAAGNSPDTRSCFGCSTGEDWILCAIGCGIALLALTVFATSTGTADCVGAGGVGADCVGARGDGVAAFGAGGTGCIAGRAGVGGGLAAGLDAVTVRGRGAFAGAGTTDRTAAI